MTVGPDWGLGPQMQIPTVLEAGRPRSGRRPWQCLARAPPGAQTAALLLGACVAEGSVFLFSYKDIVLLI